MQKRGMRTDADRALGRNPPSVSSSGCRGAEPPWLAVLLVWMPRGTEQPLSPPCRRPLAARRSESSPGLRIVEHQVRLGEASFGGNRSCLGLQLQPEDPDSGGWLSARRERGGRPFPAHQPTPQFYGGGRVHQGLCPVPGMVLPAAGPSWLLPSLQGGTRVLSPVLSGSVPLANRPAPAGLSGADALLRCSWRGAGLTRSAFSIIKSETREDSIAR